MNSLLLTLLLVANDPATFDGGMIQQYPATIVRTFEPDWKDEVPASVMVWAQGANLAVTRRATSANDPTQSAAKTDLVLDGWVAFLNERLTFYHQANPWWDDFGQYVITVQVTNLNTNQVVFSAAWEQWLEMP